MRVLRPIFSIAAAAVIAVVACSRSRDQVPKIPAFHSAPVIVISIDTLRADHLPAWGYDKGSTPNIDRLRRDGILFQNAYSHVPLTLPSHATLFSGLLPADNGVRDNNGYTFHSSDGRTLPQVLQRNRYATGAAVSAYVLRGDTGLRSIFDWYDEPIASTHGTNLEALERPGEATANAAQQWIASHRESPFFLFLHLYEPHAPYDPPEPYRAAAPTPYDGEVSHADAIVGGFLDRLRADGSYDRAIIVLLSDHGEGLNDHGEAEHGIFLYREALHVPLIIKLPKNTGAGAVIDSTVGLTDIFPTILSLTGIAIPEKLDGVAVLGPMAAPHPARRIFSESLYARHYGWSDLRSLIDDRQHYIEAPRPELYDVRKDPHERENVLEDERRAAASFRAELANYQRKLTAPSAASPEEQAKLRALGYVSSSVAATSGALPDPKDGIDQVKLFASAKHSFDSGDVNGAIRDYQAVLQKNPNFIDAAMGLARAYESAGRFDDEAETYRDILTLNPALSEQVAIPLATAFLNGGHVEEARKHAELALSSNPGGTNLLLARIALTANSPADAEKHARDAMREPAYVASATLLRSEALLAYRPPRAPEALRLLDELKTAQKQRGEAPARSLELGRANALVRMDRIDDAVRALREEIRSYPDNRDAYGELAAIYLLKGDAASGEAVLQDLVRATPTPASYTLAAKTLVHFGRTEAADSFRRRAAEVSSAP